MLRSAKSLSLETMTKPCVFAKAQTAASPAEPRRDLMHVR